MAFLPIRVSDQPGQQIDEAVGNRAVAAVLDLRDVLQLINDAFDNRTFPQHQLVEHGDQAVLHLGLEFSDHLHLLIVKRLEERL